MAKLTYLQLTNRALLRISESTITDVSTATGNALIITELINEAQNVIFMETDWYSLYTTRTFATVANTAEYAVASDFGRGIDLVNTTSDWIMTESNIQDMDIVDANADTTGSPKFYALTGSNYKLHDIPDGVYTIRDRYYKLPDTLTANANQSDLPIECEICIINYVLAGIKEYLKEYNESDRYKQEFSRNLKKAVGVNRDKLNKITRFEQASSGRISPSLPRLPSNYGRCR